MKKLAYLIFLICAGTNVSLAQNNEPSENRWQKIVVKDISLQLPKTFTIPKGKYKEFQDKSKNEKRYDTLEIIAESTGKAKKATIEVRTEIWQKGDFKKLSNLNPLSDRDLDDLDKFNKKEIAKQKEAHIVKYNPLKNNTVNGIPFVHYSYIRQLPGTPEENINVYFAYNDDRMHQIKFTSYSSDAIFWKSDFNDIINSIKITNSQ